MTARPTKPRTLANHILTDPDTLEALAHKHGGTVEYPDGRADWAILSNSRGRFCAWIDAPAALHDAATMARGGL